MLPQAVGDIVESCPACIASKGVHGSQAVMRRHHVVRLQNWHAGNVDSAYRYADTTVFSKSEKLINQLWHCYSHVLPSLAMQASSSIEEQLNTDMRITLSALRTGMLEMLIRRTDALLGRVKDLQSGRDTITCLNSFSRAEFKLRSACTNCNKANPSTSMLLLFEVLNINGYTSSEITYAG
ncbi:hypothetical protein T4A_7756 [Trichinella pseudospiralis]|uniref:Uncharacterized protein n=1 Tax=Trichinella pseudospiralis TaxID=6337 RepID=A0A0V1JTQ8_TRIPS|nr:hypothetical protein T4A_7756 [Trichinella pseudospiralis]KRZ23266.1 hypothetical protein T4C_6408 [Trichinella pseudospiralis]KRZ38324.1 hypothetical protein T4C_10974 [Trichinella pseudospiralis]